MWNSHRGACSKESARVEQVYLCPQCAFPRGTSGPFFPWPHTQSAGKLLAAMLNAGLSGIYTRCTVVRLSLIL